MRISVDTPKKLYSSYCSPSKMPLQAGLVGSEPGAEGAGFRAALFVAVRPALATSAPDLCVGLDGL